MPRQETAQVPESSSYVSFPPFRATPLPPPTTSPPNLTVPASANPPSSGTSAGTPSDTPGPMPQNIVSDPMYYDRFTACVSFGECGGWVTVRGTACAACVKAKAGSVLDRLREAAQSGR